MTINLFIIHFYVGEQTTDSLFVKNLFARHRIEQVGLAEAEVHTDPHHRKGFHRPPVLRVPV
jgi:hypothetical protein